MNYEGKSISIYKASVFNKMYHLKEASIKISPKWLKQKNEFANFMTILKGWWSEGHLRNKSAAVEWKNLKFRKSV